MFLDLAVCFLALVLAYAWIAYPLILAAVPRRRSTGEDGSADRLSVDVLVAAYNEEECIAARLQNLVAAAGDLNPSKLQDSNTPVRIWLGVDGASDGTAEAARQIASKHDGIRVHEFEERRGKVAVLKELVALSMESGGNGVEQREGGGGNVLVFTDANTIFRAGALGSLLRHFDDAKVGGVCGRLILVPATQQDPTSQHSNTPIPRPPEAAYWHWENWLKRRESDVDSCLGANGAIYAIRRELFWEAIPDNTIVDDFVIGMKVREQDRRMVYEPEALAEEEVPAQSDEWHRRVRIGAGDYQALCLCRRCLSPGFGRFAWMFWSHKVLRWLTPHILLLLSLAAGMPACDAGHAGGPSTWRALPILALLVFVASGLVGAMVSETRRAALKPFVLCDHFLTMQAALFVGFLRFCRGELSGAWRRTPRGAD